MPISDADLPQDHPLRGKPNLLVTMGLIVTAWDACEGHALLMLTWLLGDYHRSRVVFYSATSNVARSKIITELADQAHHRPETEAKAVKSLMEEWRELSTERNRVIHGEWVPDASSGELFRIGAPPDMLDWMNDSYRAKNGYSASELEDLFGRMRALTFRIGEFVLPRLDEQMKYRIKYGIHSSAP